MRHRPQKLQLYRSNLRQEGSHGVQLYALEEVELGVGGLTVHQEVHGGPQFGLSSVPDILQQLLDHVGLVDVLLGHVEDNVGHHKHIGGRQLGE